MRRDKPDKNKEIFSGTTRLEDVLPDYVELAVGARKPPLYKPYNL